MKTEFKTLKEMFPDPVLWKGYKAYFKKINTMKNKAALQKLYYKLLEKFEKGNSDLKKIKKEMQQIREQIKTAPIFSDERSDEILMK